MWFLRASLRNASPLERIAFGGAFGLGIFSYAVFLLGLLQQLNFLLALPVLLLTPFAWQGWKNFLQDRRTQFISQSQAETVSPAQWLARFLIIALLLISLVIVWLPPDSNDWDGMAYHLAAPKIHLSKGGIDFIPFMHQSNFPALLDTLFLWGLWSGGVAGAKVFHWWMWVLTILGAFAFARKLGGQGEWSALLLASTPIAIWQAGVSYIDLSTALYTALSVFALYRGVMERETKWLWAAGLMMGFALGTKYTALLSWGVLGVIGLFWIIVQKWTMGARSLIGAGLLALAIGAPWYIKNFVFTGNPVYPFAYELFGGRHWSAENAVAYRGDQLKFGLGRSPTDLLQLPWNLAAHPAPFADPLGVPINDHPYLLGASGAGHSASLFLPVASGLPAGGLWLALFALGSAVGWFFLMQQIRYLLAIFPITAALTTARLEHTGKGVKTLFIGLLTLQSLFCLWLFGTIYLSEVPSALEDREAYLERKLQPYSAFRYINQQTPAESKVILFDEPRCFYLDRNYLWGNPGHHRVILFERLETAEDMIEEFKRQGFTHVVINRAFAPSETQDRWRLHLEESIQNGQLLLQFSSKRVEVYQIQ